MFALTNYDVRDSFLRQPKTENKAPTVLSAAPLRRLIGTPLHPLALPLVLIALAALVGGTLLGGAVLAAIALGGGS